MIRRDALVTRLSPAGGGLGGRCDLLLKSFFHIAQFSFLPCDFHISRGPM